MRTARDKWMLAILPAIVILGGYAWTYGWQLKSNVKQLDQTVAVAERTRPQRQHDFAAAQNTLAVAQRTLEELRRQLAGPAALTHYQQPADNLQRLTEILKRHNLYIVISKKSEKTDKDAWSAADKDLPKRIAQQRDGTEPVLTSVELIGNYSSVQAAMEEIAKSRQCLIPQDISLQPGPPEATAGRWTLWIWL